MKSKKKLTLLSCLSALIAVAGVGTLGASAEGTAKPEALTTFAMQNAASVRTTSPFGIRFTATISGEEFAALKAIDAGLECGMLIIPADLVPENEDLDVEVKEGDLLRQSGDPEDPDPKVTNNYERIVADPIPNADGSYSITGGIKDVRTNNFSRPFMARAYVLVDDGTNKPTYYYTDTFERSIYTAATYAEANVEKEFGVDSKELEYFRDTVIGAVEDYYTDAETEITTGSDDYAFDYDYGMIQVGQTFNVKGYVTRTITDDNDTPDDETDDTTITRTLESKATLAGDNVKHVSGSTYKVTAIGDIDFTADVGKVAEVANAAVYKARQQTVAVTENLHSHLGAAYSGTLNTKFVENYQGKDAFWIDVKEDVNNTPDDVTDDVNKAQGFALSAAYLPVKKGQTLLMDMYAPTPVGKDLYVWPLVRLMRRKTLTGDKYNFAQPRTETSTAEYSMGNAASGYSTAIFDSPYGDVVTGDTVFTWKWIDAVTGADLTTAGFAAEGKGYNFWKTLAITFNTDTNVSDVFQIFVYGGYQDLYVANFRIVDADYVFATRTVTDFAMAEEQKLEYDAGETVNFNVSYTDNFNRNLVANASAFGTFTVKGTISAPTVENGAVTFGETGDVTVSYTYGDFTSETVSLLGPRYIYNIANTNLVEGRAYSSNAVNNMATFTTLDSFMGKDNVVRMQVATNGSKAVGISFGSTDNAAWKEGYYLTMELFIPGNHTDMVTSMPSGDTWIGRSASGTHHKWFMTSGELATAGVTSVLDDSARGKWVSLELLRGRTTALNASWSHLSFYPNQYSDFYVYFGNITISNRSLANVETGLMDPVKLNGDTFDKIELISDAAPLGHFITNYNTNLALTTTLAKTTEDYNEDVKAGSAYELNMTNVWSSNYALLQFTSATRANFSTYSYLYFDVYLTAAGEKFYMINGSATWSKSGSRPWAGESTILYDANGQKGDSLTEVKYYDENGVEITEGNLGTLTNQWVTVRLRTKADHPYLGWICDAVPTGRIFMKNIWFSKTADLYTTY